MRQRRTATMEGADGQGGGGDRRGARAGRGDLPVAGEGGRTVVAGDIRADLARQGRERPASEGGADVEMGLDITDAEQAATGIEQVADEFGALDILVNNAGIDLTVPIDELAVDEWDRVMAVNLRGAVRAVASSAAAMKRAGRRPDRQHLLHRGQARVAERLGLPREQVGAARLQPRAARRGAAGRREGHGARGGRHAHAVPLGPLPGHRPVHAAGPRERGRGRALRAVACRPRRSSPR